MLSPEQIQALIQAIKSIEIDNEDGKKALRLLIEVPIEELDRVIEQQRGKLQIGEALPPVQFERDELSAIAAADKEAIVPVLQAAKDQIALHELTKELKDLEAQMEAANQIDVASTTLTEDLAEKEAILTSIAESIAELLQRFEQDKAKFSEETAQALRQKLNETQRKLDASYELLRDIRRKQPDPETDPLVDITGGHVPGPQVKPVDKPSPKATAKVFLMEQDSLLDFVDSLETASNLHDPVKEEGLSLRTDIANAPYFKGIKIPETQVIYSRCNFGEDKDKKPRIGKIVQNHRGVVSDRSTGNLTDDEKSLVAIKAAKMLLSNYPGYGEIFITAPLSSHKDVVTQANKVYAAILLLQKDNPELANLKIVSLVKGCDGPGKNATPSQIDKFVNKHLKSIFPKAAKESDTLKELSFYQKELKDKLNEARQKAEDTSSFHVHEGDEIRHGKLEPQM
ncbi:Uncharacterised protein (plasmid) [Legionella adelaidensis]|uniref:Uncharacterized protein n=1 Tax=Legionella adelaidensis TaxID=45056 RepID=A0A0W0R3D6_9GAMM|nr:hypothetical protein [Legionella adelaidensis]KTC65548.1 hypothetical protein Lade_0206 [Legionella adelaidensis]VEH84631.1 Uncharacterised protein [Legionella adelaidensis]